MAPCTFCVPWVEEVSKVRFMTFVRRVADVAKGYRLTRLASETNGVGAAPTQELKARTRWADGGPVVEVATTAASKEDGFGKLKVLLSQGRLALPRHPALLRQLAALEFQERDSGTVRIAVPEAGYAYIAMALCLAAGEATSPPRLPVVGDSRWRRARSRGATHTTVIVASRAKASQWWPRLARRPIPPGQVHRVGKFVVDRRYWQPPRSRSRWRTTDRPGSATPTARASIPMFSSQPEARGPARRRRCVGGAWCARTVSSTP